MKSYARLLCLGLFLLVFTFILTRVAPRSTAIPGPQSAAGQPAALPARASQTTLAGDSGSLRSLTPSAAPTTVPSANTNAVEAFEHWRSRYQAPGASQEPGLLSEGVSLARARREALRELIVRDPRAALRAAVPPAARAGLPPEVTALLEEPVSARGDLNVLFARPPAGQEQSCSEPVIRTVQLPGRFYYAYTFGRRLRQMSTPATSIIGIAVDDRLALLDRPYRVLETAEAAASPQAIAAASGACPVCGQPLPGSLADTTCVDAGGMVLALHSAAEASAFFTAPDGTTIWAAGGTGGTGTNSPVVPATTSQGDKKFLFMRVRFADDAATYEPETDTQVRGDLDTTMRRFAELSYGTLQGSYGFTPTLTLPKARAGYLNGWSDVDGMTALLNDAKAQAALIASDPAFPGVAYPFHPTNYTIFAVRWNGEPGGCCSYGGGGNAWIRWDGASVLIHEWGHAVGEPHANWWGPATDDPIGPGTHEEYGNSFDNMGGGGIEEDYGAMHKALVKWLPSTNYWTVTTNGIYRIYAHDQPTLLPTNCYGLKVFRATRDDTYYWLEHRAYTVSGANAFYWTNGVAATREWDWELLDMTPGSAGGKNDCPLTIGRTWSDGAAGVHYTAVARGNTPQPWVEVAVNFDDPARPNHPPVAVLSANSYTPAASVSVTLTATALDPDGDTLAYAWDFGDGTLSVNNLASQTKSWSSAGTYVVQCKISDRRGGLCLQSLVIKVGTPTDYTASGRVTTADGTPLSNVRLTAASGKTTVSGSDGTFVFGRLSAGSYTFTAAHNRYTFTPASRTVTLGPSVAGLDFVSATDLGPGSGATRQVWLGLSGGAVSDLTNNARFPNSPDLEQPLADALESPLDWKDSYGQRVRAFFVPPLSGGYRFYIASDDASELYLSPTTNAAAKSRIAYLSSWTDSRNWTANASQKSALLQLAAGQRYYLEALQKEGSGGDHVEVGIDLPDGTQEKPIPYHRLIPLTAAPAPATLVSVFSQDPAAIEGSDTASFTLSRNGDTNAALEVFFRLSGTAAYGADYGATGLKATIPAGQTNTLVTISPINDAVAELPETVVLGLVPGTNYTVAPLAASATVTINDNDGTPTVSLLATGPNASKVGPQPGRFTLQRTGSAGSLITVNYTVSGSATNGTDYAWITNKVTLAAGQGSADIDILPGAASGLEPPKTVVLTLGTGTGYTVGSPSSATVTIAQPGPGLGWLREWWLNIGGSGTIGDLTNYSGYPASPSGREFLTSIAEGPHDWDDSYGDRFRGWFIAPMTGSYYFYIASDDAGELWLGTNALAAGRRRIAYVSSWTDYRQWSAQTSQKSAAITLTAGQRYYLEALHAEGGGGDHCSVGVQFPNGALERPITAQWLEPWTDKGTLVAVFATATTATEGGAAGEFTLQRTGDTSAPLAVSFAISGTAANGTDYSSLATNATFSSGQSELKLPVQALLDSTVEGPETVTLTLRTNAAYDTGFADSATVTIVGDPPRATVSAIDAAAGEAGANTGTFRIAFPSATYGPVTFNYTLSGTATAGVDYLGLPGSVTLATGQVYTNLTVTPLSDAYIEGPETVTLTLAPGEGYLAGSPASATLTIADANTNRPPTLAAVANRTLFAGQTLTLTNTASDPDLPAQNVSFGLANAPAGARVDAASGLLTWRPTLAQSPLITRLEVTATDSGSPALSVTQSFWVAVNRPTNWLVAPGLSAAGFTFRVEGDPGPDLTLQRSTNLLDWSTLLTTNSPALPWEWSDPEATNAPRGFYRLLLGP